MKKVIFFSFLIFAFSATMLSQEIASARLQGMGIGSAYLIDDYETDILKFPVLSSKINKRYGALLFNPITLNYNRFTYFEKSSKTIYGIQLGYEDGFGWNKNSDKKESFIQVFFGRDNNIFGYKLLSSDIKNHYTSSYESVTSSRVSIRNTNNINTDENFTHLLSYSTMVRLDKGKELLLNFSLGYNTKKTNFDYNIYENEDSLYDSLETYHHFIYNDDFDNVIYYEYYISENGYKKSSDFTINISAQIEQLFLKKFPTNLFCDIVWKHSILNTVSGNFNANELVRYITEDNNGSDSIAVYIGNKIYDLKKEKNNELVIMVGSGTLYQLSKKFNLLISGKSFFNYNFINETFRNELTDERIIEKNTIFRYEGYTNFGCEYYIAKKIILRSGFSWLLTGTARKTNYLDFKKIKYMFTPEMRLKIVTGISYSYSDNLNFDMAVNISNRSEELLISTIYKF